MFKHMDLDQETFGERLYLLRTSRHMSGRDLAARANVEASLISRVENGKKAAGPVTVEKLANGLELIGDERSAFVKAGMGQSVRTAQAFGPNMASPLFRSVLCDLLRTLGLKGEVRGFQAEIGSGRFRYDLVVTMVDGTVYGLNFKLGEILVAVADPTTGQLPAPASPAFLALGGFIAKVMAKRTQNKA